MTVDCMVVLWIIVGIAAAILVWGVILQLPKTRGWAFEKIVAWTLAFLPRKEYTVINNLFFREGRKTCQIDHLVVSRYGVFVIEAKNYLGVISGNGRERMLRRRVLGMRYNTRNPIDQNEWHIRYLREHFPTVRQHQEALVPMVVFNFSSFPKIKNAPCPVCKIQGLIKTIRSYKTVTLDEETVFKITQELQQQNRNR